MPADLVLADDGLTVEFESADECEDLTADEAEAVTSRIRQWVNDFPIADVVLAFRGRVWIALAYASWAEWCECELGGLKLPAPKRRDVVAELAGEGMSNRAIAEVVGASEPTVRRDVKAGASNDAPAANAAPDRRRLGQDGKSYTPPQPKPAAPESEPEFVDAEIVCRDCDGHGCETCFPAHDSASDLIEALADGDGDLADELTESLNSEVPKPAAPQRKAPRSSIIDSARNIGLDLAKLTTRIENLSADDRLTRSKAEIGARLRHQLGLTIKACQGLEQQLTQGA